MPEEVSFISKHKEDLIGFDLMINPGYYGHAHLIKIQGDDFHAQPLGNVTFVPNNYSNIMTGTVSIIKQDLPPEAVQKTINIKEVTLGRFRNIPSITIEELNKRIKEIYKTGGDNSELD